jgi:hypothetical protein
LVFGDVYKHWYIPLKNMVHTVIVVSIIFFYSFFYDVSESSQYSFAVICPGIVLRLLLHLFRQGPWPTVISK